MNFSIIRQKFIKETKDKFLKLYKINLDNRYNNPYASIKYKYILELGSIFSFFFLKINLSANKVTFLNIFFCLLSLIFFLINKEILVYIALLIFFSKNILDNVDGFIARYKNKKSLFGEKLDLWCGKFYYHTILFCFGLNNFYLSKNPYSVIIVLIIFILDYMIPKKNEIKSKLNEIKKSKTIFKNIFSISKIMNYDARTSITDFIILIILLEKYYQIFYLSQLIIFTFLILKILRNLTYFFIAK